MSNTQIAGSHSAAHTAHVQPVRAQPVHAQNGHAQIGQYLTFMLGGELLAIDILSIKEILEYGTPTKVPMMPKFICGVINLRGGVLPVIDLSALFEQPTAAVTRRSCIIVVELEDAVDASSQCIGVLVDTVNEVIDISAANIKPEPTFGMRVRTDFINGIAQHGERFVILLNMSRVLSMADIALPQQ